MTVELEAGIVGRDSETLCGFYTSVMGFAVVDRLDAPEGTVYKLRRDAARIKLFFPRARDGEVAPVTAVDPWYRPGGWRYAGLSLARLSDVDELAAAVAAAGGRVLIEPVNHRPAARMALVCDPEGNVWELLAESAEGEHPHP